jgi:hypothetical protein
MKKNIPTFQFVIDDSEESGVKAISIVGDPAFESSMISFSKEKPRFVALADKKYKQICAGLSLIPDVPIYRVDEIFGEYYGYFSKETIEQIVEKYHQEMNMNKVNLEHNDSKYIDAFMIEDYIVDTPQRAEDLRAKGIDHKNIVGSWYTAFKIKDKNVFESIINGNTGMGFSVEAYLDRFSNQINDKFSKMKKDKKSLLEKIVKIFTNEEDFKENRSSVPELGFDIEWGKPGEPVNQVTVDPNGNEVLAPVGPGEFITDAGTIVVDDSSNLVEVRPVAGQPTGSTAPVASVSGSTETPIVAPSEKLEAYPWDQCISDQQAKGISKEGANKICGWIKNNNSTQKLTDEQIKEILAMPEDSGNTVNAPVTPAPDASPVEPVDPPVSQATLNKTIGELVGTIDGEYWVQAIVENGKVTEVNVSSDTQLLKSQLAEVTKENNELKDKLKEPIGEPILGAPVEKKEWSKMNAYERALQRTREDQ